MVRSQTKVYVHEIILDLYAWSSQNVLTKMEPQDMRAECQIGVSAFQEGKQVGGWKTKRARLVVHDVTLHELLVYFSLLLCLV